MLRKRQPGPHILINIDTETHAVEHAVILDYEQSGFRGEACGVLGIGLVVQFH